MSVYDKQVKLHYLDCVPVVLNKDNVFLESFLQRRSTCSSVFEQSLSRATVNMFSSRSTHESLTCMQNSSEFVLLMVFIPRQVSKLVEDVSIRLWSADP